MKFKHLALLALASAMTLAIGCKSGGSGGEPGNATKGPAQIYNKFNIHVVESPSRNGTVSRASYANWVAPISEHWIIPPGTKMRVLYRRRGIFPGYEITLEDGRKVYYEFNARNTGMSAAEYLSVITSQGPVNHQGLSKKDQEGIKTGKALTGMSKLGVRVALGHPAPHRTPSLKQNQWIYWRDRYRTMVVQFDENGKVASVR